MMDQALVQQEALSTSNVLSGTLIEEIQQYLLAEEPNISRLHQQLASQFGLSMEDAQHLLYRVVAQVNAALFPPVTRLEIIHTEGCNLACSYCFEKNMLGVRKMPLKVALAAVDLLFDYSRNEPQLSIIHFGGEPTLNFPAIKHVTEYAEQKAAALGKTLEFDMTSNGVLIDEEKAEYFATHKIKVLLSIDGLEARHNQYRLDRGGHGTFSKVMKGFAILKKTQKWIGVKMTIMPVNAAHLYEDVLGLYDLGVNQFIIGYATGVHWPLKDMNTYGTQLGRVFRWYKETPRDDLRISEFDEQPETSFFGCQAGRVSITAAVNGEISPCAKILALNNKQLLAKLGDVQYGLTHMINRADLVTASRLRTACEAQQISDNFQGGCFASNYEDNGDLFQPSLQDHSFSLLTRSACSGCSACQH